MSNTSDTHILAHRADVDRALLDQQAPKLAAAFNFLRLFGETDVAIRIYTGAWRHADYVAQIGDRRYAMMIRPPETIYNAGVKRERIINTEVISLHAETLKEEVPEHQSHFLCIVRGVYSKSTGKFLVTTVPMLRLVNELLSQPFFTETQPDDIADPAT